MIKPKRQSDSIIRPGTVSLQSPRLVYFHEEFDSSIGMLAEQGVLPPAPNNIIFPSYQQTLSAIVGRIESMSPVLGATHPDYPNGVHPVHNSIAQALKDFATPGKVNICKKLPSVNDIKGNVAIIGGPLASRHAAALFGTAENPSILSAPLPVSFDLRRVSQGNSSTHDQARMIIDGKTTSDECFVITNLPMSNRRFINISALSAYSGKAAQFILKDEYLMNKLFWRASRIKNGGWQAVFRVTGDQGRKIDEEIGFFEVKNINFESDDYPLKNPDFMKIYSEDVNLDRGSRKLYPVNMGKKSKKEEIIREIRADTLLRASLVSDPEFRELVGLPDVSETIVEYSDNKNNTSGEIEITGKGWIKTKSLSKEFANIRRAEDAERQRKSVANKTDAERAEWRERKSELQRQRRAKSRR